MFIPCEFSDRQYHRALRLRTGQIYGIGLPGPHETAVCEKFGRCAGCPYPKHGKICWNEDGSCLRTEMEAVYRKKTQNGTVKGFHGHP